MQVYNYKIDEIPHGCARIMRSSYWGNPYVIGKDGDRGQVIEQYRILMRYRLKCNRERFVAKLTKLAQSNGLVCCCSPLPCHGDVIVEFMVELGLIDRSRPHTS